MKIETKIKRSPIKNYFLRMKKRYVINAEKEILLLLAIS